jgi:hypothetical protein
MKIIRVFPRRTSFTPTDDYVFVGDPPMIRPEADEVHVSCTFTWDIAESKALAEAWSQYYPTMLGGVAIHSPADGFTPNLYVRNGVTFSTRGCNNHCPWCLVSWREGELRLLEIKEGYIIADNNLLQAPQSHTDAVFQMLGQQKKAAIFSGGLDARLITDSIADQLRSLRINQLFLACDTEGSLKPLRLATDRLKGLGRDKLRCYVLLAYNGETIQQAEDRLVKVWEAGCMPFAQIYQPPERKKIEYPKAWRDLARTWSRPAAMKARMSL